jgi:hypothetical protein
VGKVVNGERDRLREIAVAAADSWDADARRRAAVAVAGEDRRLPRRRARAGGEGRVGVAVIAWWQGWPIGSTRRVGAVVFDLRNLTRGEQIAGLAGVGLFVIMLAFKWYGVKAALLDGTVEGLTQNAVQAFTVIDLVLLLTAIAAVALALWGALGRPATGPIPPGVIVAALGGIALVLIAFRLISPPDLEIALPDEFGVESARVSDFPDPNPYEVTRKIGPWLGLVAAALIAGGGYLSARHPASAPSGDRSLPSSRSVETT